VVDAVTSDPGRIVLAKVVAQMKAADLPPRSNDGSVSADYVLLSADFDIEVT